MLSEVFACNSCCAPVALAETPAHELIYECQNPRCRRCVSVDTPEALALIEDVSLVLHAKEVVAV